MLQFLKSLLKMNGKFVVTNTNSAKQEAFYHLFKKELFAVVLKQVDIFPSKITKESLRFSGKMTMNIALTNKSFYQYLKNTLCDLSKMYFLYSKYSKYNSEYENPSMFPCSGSARTPYRFLSFVGFLVKLKNLDGLENRDVATLR